ncbi:FIMAH domain-containing protein [Paenibacillus allorhizosphaerae]|nr:fibronectin type III domain-containing protein [Paenibacillus allorhizosphaerae]
MQMQAPALAAEDNRAPSAAAVTVPPLLITEVVPDTTNVGSSDGYEFVEVYNATDQAIDFADYALVYRYPSGPQRDVVWKPAQRHLPIAPGGTLVVWLGNEANQSKTAADFNANFGSSLTDNVSLVKVMTNGLVNERMRELLVVTNAGEEIAVAAYNDGSFDVASNKGVLFKYPEDGSNRMVKTSARTKPASPGTVEPGQVPERLLHLGDASAPAITNVTRTTSARPLESIEIVADARDDVRVVTMTLYYKNAEQSEFTQVSLGRDRSDGFFKHAVDFMNTIDSEALHYYFTASDGTHQTTSETYTIPIIRTDNNPRLNLKDGEAVSGTRLVQATMNGTAPSNLALYLDGTVVGHTYRKLEQPSFFVFEAEGIDATFQNAVTMGNDVVHLLDYAIAGYTTVAVPIGPERLAEGSNTITLRAGSKKTPFETTPGVNLDDFNVRNVRLIMADGTVLRDPKYSDPKLVFDMGDGGRYLPAVDFTFQLSADRMTSLALNWDTTGIRDGEHWLKVAAPNNKEAVVRVVVDNTKPVIESTLSEGRQYVGAFVVDAAVSDQGSGLPSVKATLDLKPIELPYRTSSDLLTPGSHTFHVTATDQAGNAAEKTVRFSTAEPLSAAIRLISPVDGESDAGTQPLLKVNVTSSVYENMDITFFKGNKYTTASSANVKAYTNHYPVEPPQTNVPDGEHALSKDEADDVSAQDGRYLIQDSTEHFPYVRFEVKLDETVDTRDTVELVWGGKSLPGRKVTMYAWDYGLSRWDAVDSSIPETEADFTLRGTVDVPQYVRNHTVNVLVQDQIPTREQYDYTMVWLSDTQFYTEMYPDIYSSQVNWIRDRKDEMNIRYVIHTGDIVNEVNQDFEWQTADRSMRVLEQAGIPYGVLAGNHDVDDNGTVNYTNYARYFGENRFSNQPHYGKSYQDNRGHYDLVSAGGKDYMFLYMGWDIGDEEMAWMNDALASHPERTAFIAVHDYLNPDGVRSETGNAIYRNVVVPNANVVGVLSGHYTGSSVKIDTLDDNADGVADRTVYQLLNDYQGLREGGSGYLKLLHFDADNGQVIVNSYSPYKNDYNFYDPPQAGWQEELTMSLNLEPQVKRVATDYFEAKVYTGEAIGSVTNVPNGQNAEMKWNGLNTNQTAHWYVRAEDRHGRQLKSELWSFSTGQAIAAPANLKAASVTDTSVTLQWDPVSDPGGNPIRYDIYRNGSLYQTVTGSVYTASGLMPRAEYEFYVKAVDAQGRTSQPSGSIMVKTLINASVVRRLTEDYIASGQLTGPLATQLSAKIKQAEHQFGKGSQDQAAKFVQDYIQHLNQASMQQHITAGARDVLNEAGAALLSAWGR